jgi:uncharacterized protein (TIGR00725 family)
MSQRKIPLLIAVIGGGYPPPEALPRAWEVGWELAKRGAIVLCGGLTGVMEAVAKGVREGGGQTIGLLPGDNPAEANPFVDIPLATGLGYARNAVITRAALAVIAVDGAFGTLSEIGYALADGTTVVGLDTWTFAANGRDDTSIVRATSPRDAVEKAIAAAERRIKPEARGWGGPP